MRAATVVTAVCAAVLVMGCGGGSGLGGGQDAQVIACGNGEQETGEECDGDDLGGATCVSLGWEGGPLACDSQCVFDVSACEGEGPQCGDGTADYGEACDGDDLNGQQCSDQGFDGGELACDGLCAFDTTGCTHSVICGNGVAQPGEECDGDDLGGATCVSLGFEGGELGCATNCTHDTSRCEGVVVGCGNGLREPPEQCDGSDLGGATCAALGYTGGTLLCDGQCRLDAGGCTGGCSASGGSLGCADVVNGDTGGGAAVNEVDQWAGPGCEDFQMTGPEILYELTMPAGDGVRATLTGLSGDLDLFVLEDTGIGCTSLLPCVRWSGNGGSQNEELVFYAYPGVTYYVVVDGFQGADSPFSLELECVDVEICDDGQDNDGDGEVDCEDGDCDGAPQCYVLQIYEHFPYNSASRNWDLNNTRITFTPDPAELSGYAWSTQPGVVAYPTTPGTGATSTVLAFAQPDDAVEVTFSGSLTFPFFGQSYGSMWVNSNGTITFGVADPDPTEGWWQLLHGPPRVAGCWDSYDVTAGGSVTVDEFVNRIVVTFHQVPDPDHGGVLHSFQLELYWSGVILLSNLQHPGYDGLVGISAGGGNHGDPQVDFHDPGPQPLMPGLFELFQGGGDDFDLESQLITFTPDSGVPAGYTYLLSMTSLGWPHPPGGGTVSSAALSFNHGDTFVPVTLTPPHTVSFFGQTYDTVYVGANGYLTFEDGDTQWTPSAAAHFGLPRISGHFYDWEPDDGGTVTVDEFQPPGGQYTLVVTFQDVPHYDNPHPTISFQMAINASGQVRFFYDDVNTNGGLVGLSSGQPGTLPTEVNFRP